MIMEHKLAWKRFEVLQMVDWGNYKSGKKHGNYKEFDKLRPNQTGCNDKYHIKEY